MRAFVMALGLYTVFPGTNRWHDEDAGLLAPMLPFVGLALGICWWLLALLMVALVPRMLGAAILALAMPALTGFLHLDGFMDVADALLSRRERAEKLRILKDPHTGAFAVISLCALLMIGWAAAESVLAFNRPYGYLIVIPVIARAMAALSLMRIEPISQSQYGRMNYDGGTKRKQQVCIAMLTAALVVAILAGDFNKILLCAITAAGYMVACRGAVRTLGGMNGDIAGFSITCAEVCGLLALAL